MTEPTTTRSLDEAADQELRRRAASPGWVERLSDTELLSACILTALNGILNNTANIFDTLTATEEEQPTEDKHTPNPPAEDTGD